MKQLFLGCIALYLSFNVYGQKKAVKKTSPPPPRVEVFKEKQASDTRLRNTRWKLTIDTSDNAPTLTLRKLRKGDQAACLIHFINGKDFAITVNMPGCSFKAAGTYILNFIDASTEGVVQIGAPNMLSFNRSNNLNPCAEQIKQQISASYLNGYYDEAGFMLEPYRPVISIQQ